MGLKSEDDDAAAERPPPAAAAIVLRRRRRVEFQWFLIALSVRPGRRRDMVAHLLPWTACALRMMLSSAGVNGRCCTSGLSWLHHRRRHDFPDLPGIPLLIADQFLGPCCATSFSSVASSSGLHDPLIRSAPLDFVPIMVPFSTCSRKCPKEEKKWRLTN